MSTTTHGPFFFGICSTMDGVPKLPDGAYFVEEAGQWLKAFHSGALWFVAKDGLHKVEVATLEDVKRTAGRLCEGQEFIGDTHIPCTPAS
jgi:hypothetical protein